MFLVVMLLSVVVQSVPACGVQGFQGCVSSFLRCACTYHIYHSAYSARVCVCEREYINVSVSACNQIRFVCVRTALYT